MARASPLQRKSGDGPAKAGPRARTGRSGPGNGSPGHAFGPVVQTKMSVGPAHDRFEAEADRTAARVVDGTGPVAQPSRLPSGSTQRRPAAGKGGPKAEEDVQRKAAAKKGKPDEDVQRKPAAKKGKPDEEVQRDIPAGTNGSAGPTTAPSSVEGGVRAARGGGQPLSPTTRSSMESGFGQDFGAVRVHHDAAADRMAGSLNSRAFTTGPDIFFSRGAFNDRTKSGQRLLAHELTHVAQQTQPGRLQTKRIQRQEDGNTPNPPPGGGEPEVDPPKPQVWPESPKANRGIDLNGPHGLLYKLDELEVPNLASRRKGVTAVGSVTGGLAGATNTFVPGQDFHWTGKGHRSVVDVTTGEDDNSTQVQIWESWVKQNSEIAAKIIDKFSKSKNVFTRGTDGPRVYYLQHMNQDARSFTLIGSAEELAKHATVLRPPYGKTGSTTQFMQVDHYIEIQLGGMHVIENMWLLDAEANQKSGRDIKNNVVKDINKLIADADKDGFWGDTNPPKPAPLKSWPAAGHIEFGRVRGTNLRSASWDKEDIAKGKQIDRLKELSPSQMAAAGLGLEPGDQPAVLSIFLSKDSAFRRIMKVEGEALTYGGSGAEKDFISGFDLESAVYRPLDAASMQNDAEIGTITGRAFRKREVKTPDGTMKVVEVPGFSIPVLLRNEHGFESYLNRGAMNEALQARKAVLTGASPIAFTDARLTDAWELLARGTVTADNPLFPGLVFGITLLGDAIILDVTIPLDRLQLGPFKPTEANLSLGVGEDGLIYAGTVAFMIEGVGSGMLTADEEKLAGKFGFDLEAFDPADVEVAYENGVWSGGTTLGIKSGVVPFVDDASVEVRVDENGFFMEGTAVLAGPGIPAGTTLAVKYDEETGEFKFGADIPFNTAAIPGLSSARAAVALTRKQDGTWSIAGAGAATISLPAISGQALAAYQDGFLDVNGEAAVSRPPMTGTAEFHLSNRQVNKEGEVVEGPPLESFRIWGSGSASITFGDYITGTVGIAFLENGEMELVGTIALPPVIELVSPTVYDYDILDFPQVRIPIIGLTIPVINKSFGVFAFIGGGIDANLTLGPGNLVETQVTVSYNPDHPEEASITGGSTFEVSAGAEVGLSVTGGIGAGLGIVEATGEVGLRGALGIDLTGGASVTLNWTPTEGLAVDAGVFGEASPKFRLSVIAGAKIEVDAFLWSGTLWSREWDHTLAEIGPDMTWRAELPATWSEQNGLDVDINKLEITKPDIDLLEFGKEVFEAIV